MNTQRPYPLDAYYCTARDAAREVQRNLQAPDALIGSSFLTAMSIVCQGNIDVQLPTGQVRPVSLDIMTIADSGERKTATDTLVCAPIYKFDADNAKSIEGTRLLYGSMLRLWENTENLILRKLARAMQTRSAEDEEACRQELVAHVAGKPEKPISTRLIHQNITERPLMKSLQGDSRSAAILSDEGDIILRGGAMQKLGMLNKMFDGPATLSLDRVDESITINNPRLTISFMVQERIFSAFMRRRGEAVRASGHLARYLVAWPASTQGFRFMSLEEPSWVYLPGFHERVLELLTEYRSRIESGVPVRTVLSFTMEATEHWVRMQNRGEAQVAPGGDLFSVRDFVSKSMELASRVAAILHYFSGQAGTAISLETLNRALDLVGWHFDEFIRLFGEQAQVPQFVTDASSILSHLSKHYVRHGLRNALRNDVRKRGPVREQGRFEAALQHLCYQGAISLGYEPAPRGKGRNWIHIAPGVV